MSARSILTLALAALACGASCSREPEAPAAPPHVVIYLIDTLRQDRLGVYGYPRPISPHIDALAGESVVVDECHAAAPWTLPSVVSLFTSTFPAEHRVLSRGDRIASNALLEALRDLGYRTASFVTNPFAGQAAGLDRGFDHFVQYKGHAFDTDDVEAWLRTAGAEPQFLYLHSTEPHRPYRPPQRFLARFGQVDDEVRKDIGATMRHYRDLTRVDADARRARGTTDNTAEQREAIQKLAGYREEIEILYDASVAWADENVGNTIAALQRLGMWERTLFLLISDHGEELYDRGGWLHADHLHRELIRVPMLWRFPDVPAGRPRGVGPVTLIDVMPTLLAYLGHPGSGQRRAGRDLMPWLRGTAPAAEPELRIISNRFEQTDFSLPIKRLRGDVNVGVADGRWKGIWNAEPRTLELYDLRDDPWERDDASAEHADEAARLQRFAESWLEENAGAAPADSEEVPADVREQLKALGYY
ncbi:MAG TPA: sulfatase [Myxococcota bacterium]